MISGHRLIGEKISERALLFIDTDRDKGKRRESNARMTQSKLYVLNGLSLESMSSQ
jgi:hypothetical protein